MTSYVAYRSWSARVIWTSGSLSFAFWSTSVVLSFLFRLASPCLTFALFLIGGFSLAGTVFSF